MRSFFRFVLAGILLGMTGLPCRAQQMDSPSAGKWSGNADLASGYGLRRADTGAFSNLSTALHHLWEQGSVRLTYSEPKLFFTTHLKGKYEWNTTQVNRVSVYPDDKVSLSTRVDDFHRPEAQWDARLRWRPSRTRWYEWDARYDFYYQRRQNGNGRARFGTDAEQTDISMEIFAEEQDAFRHTATVGFQTSHLFPEKHRSLYGNLRWRSRFEDTKSLWMRGTMTGDDDEPTNPHVYSLQPSGGVHELSGAVLYRDSTLAGVKNLFLESGLQMMSRLTADSRQGKVMQADESWRDSTRLRENFRFLEILIDPCFKLQYRLNPSFRVGADYIFRLSLRRLRSIGNPHEKMRPVRPAVLGRTFVEWSPSKLHTFTVGSTVDFKEPPYVQLSAFRRQGNEARQLIRGNPNLDAMRSVSADLQYQFRWKGLSLLSYTQYIYRSKEAERTFYEEELDGVKYRVFTWYNTASGQTFLQRLRLGWNGKWVGMYAEAVYRQTLQRALLSETVKKNNHWEAAGGVEVHPGKGWFLTARASYQGDVKTFYSLLKSYCTVNVRLEKRFRLFTLYVEGRDLADMPRKITFFSQDLSESWYEQQRLNRRLFLLGATWLF